MLTVQVTAASAVPQDIGWGGISAGLEKAQLKLPVKCAELQSGAGIFQIKQRDGDSYSKLEGGP